MKKQETMKEFTRRVLREVRVDVDVDYCKAHGIKFRSYEDEKDVSTADLFSSESIKRHSTF